MVENIISVTQWSVGVITLFLGVFVLFAGLLSYLNFKAASAPKRDLKQLRAEMGKVSEELKAMKKELEELREFKKGFDGATLLSI